MNKNQLCLLTAALATVPGIYARLSGVSLSPFLMVLASGVAIMSAAFLLLWACDAAQSDISQSLALAVVALMSVLPEYAVDMYFTWQAGQNPGSHYASYAAANMTGANRLIIGVAWSVIALIVWFKSRQPVQLEKERRLEIVMLAIATLYAFVIPIKGSLAWYDMIVFLGIYGYYLYLSSRRPVVELEFEGPADELTRLSKPMRRLATAGLFLFAGSAILANAKPFCEGLILGGKSLGINEFLLVQWLGPIASEAPEFIVAIMFSLRGNGGIALGSLLSAKLNQWTLLVGMIPGVYALSSGTLRHSIPMDRFQFQEILLTAAQSILALFMIANLRFSIRYAIVLLTLFSVQIASPVLVNLLPEHKFMGLSGDQMHNVFSMLYIVGALLMLIEHPSRLKSLLRLDMREEEKLECANAGKRECHDYPNCAGCANSRKPSSGSH
jgi:cation:H+ antiporter